MLPRVLLFVLAGATAAYAQSADGDAPVFDLSHLAIAMGRGGGNEPVLDKVVEKREVPDLSNLAIAMGRGDGNEPSLEKRDVPDLSGLAIAMGRGGGSEPSLDKRNSGKLKHRFERRRW